MGGGFSAPKTKVQLGGKAHQDQGGPAHSSHADLPRHWEKKEAESSADGFAIHPINDDDAKWLSLSDCLQTRGDWLDEGHDVKEKEKYDQLQLVRD